MPARDIETDLDIAESEAEALRDKGIPELQKRAHACAIKSGFYEESTARGLEHRSGPGVIGLLCLIHSEISEAMEADRKDDARSFAEELADVAIRLFDIAEFKGINLEKEILEKMDTNDKRDFRHGNKKY